MFDLLTSTIEQCFEKLYNLKADGLRKLSSKAAFSAAPTCVGAAVVFTLGHPEPHSNKSYVFLLFFLSDTLSDRAIIR